MDCYNIGDTLFLWDGGGYELARGEYMEKFRHIGPWNGDTIQLRGKIEPLQQYTLFPCILIRHLFSVYDVNGERLILYHWAYLRNAYGVWVDRITQGREDVCSFDPALFNQLPLPADSFFGLSGLQKALLMQGKPVLHSSYIEWKGRAILFTAPSETGKSTQARLWEESAGARIINGDRALLAKRGDIWYAFGFPNCGSSSICINKAVPLHTIVVLEQGMENYVEQMTPGEKNRCLTTGICIYPWDPIDLECAMDIAQKIITDVPVVRLVCRPDVEAVDVLRQYLEGE